MNPQRVRAKCRRCGAAVKSFSRMRKWCVDCRRIVSLERAKIRRTGRIADPSLIEGGRSTAQESA